MTASKTNFSRMITVLMPVILLSACGGGGGGSSPAVSSTPVATATPEPAPAPAPDPAPVAAPGSSRLADNPLPDRASFDNFAATEAVIPVRDVGFVGSKLFVKVSRSDGETLYLGAVPRDRDFSLPIHVPLDDGKVLYEIFSNSAADQIIFGEVSL